MATERRKRTNRYRRAKVYAYLILCLLVVIGFAAGRLTAHGKTITKVVEVPAVAGNSLPETTEVTYFNVPLSHNLQKYIYEICAEENVPVTLVMAMIEHESQFDTEIVSSTGDYGLMQINEVNHEQLEEEYRCADMTDPYQNVFCGIKIIGSYIEKYENLSKALMAYNMGDYGANKAWGEGLVSTSYTETILDLMQTYEKEIQHE